MKKNRARKFRSALSLALSAAIVTAGCKATPAKPAGFIDATQTTHDPTVPFHRFWIKPGFDFARYHKVYVAPVNTAYMLRLSDFQKGERKDQIAKDVANLGKYAQDTIKKAFRDDKAHRYEVVEEPVKGSDTLELEVALTELVPSKVLLNALGYAPFFIGLTLTAVRAIAHDVSTVAFEARIRTADTGEVVVLIADREAEQFAIISVRGLTWYSHAEFIIAQWAQQLVKVAERKGNEKVKEMDPFTLQPW